MDATQVEKNPEKKKKTFSLTEFAIRKVESIANKYGMSESTVVEMLIRKYADKLDEEFGA